MEKETYRLVENVSAEDIKDWKKRGIYKFNYTITYPTVAAFAPGNIEPLVVTKQVWNTYFKQLWDKGYYTKSYKQAVSACNNPDKEWLENYRSEQHISSVYKKKRATRTKLAHTYKKVENYNRNNQTSYEKLSIMTDGKDTKNDAFIVI